MISNIKYYVFLFCFTVFAIFLVYFSFQAFNHYVYADKFICLEDMEYVYQSRPDIYMGRSFYKVCIMQRDVNVSVYCKNCYYAGKDLFPGNGNDTVFQTSDNNSVV